MASEPIILRLNQRTIKDLDQLAAKNRQTREQLISELVRESFRRDQVRTHIREIAARKRRNGLVAARAKKYLADPARVSSKQLDKDIAQAVRTVRSAKKS